jgi:predicted acylesterase/phospholipase RssA
VVTGVSTGALIAPFAFLGPDWDAKLEEAFTGPAANDLLSPRGFGALLFGPSIYRGGPLERLVGHYVDDALLKAVAQENARGRKLLVATTDLDRQETVIWNMGEIAARGGPQARRLFRKVLVASASVPGVFPPKLIEVRDGDAVFQEMHADGGISAPFFSVPPSALFWTEPTGLFQRARLYVIVNGQLGASPQTTRMNTVAVIGRSFDTVELSAARDTLSETQAFCARNGIAFQAAALPPDIGPAAPFDFSAKNRNRLFRLGERLGASGEAWNLAKPN